MDDDYCVLQQGSLSKLFPSLLEDVESPSSLLPNIFDICLWAADKGVIEGLHQDAFDQVVTVVKGEVRITMVACWRYGEVKPKTNSLESLLFSELGDISNLGAVQEKYPQSAPALQEAITIDLKEGDAIFIPSFTWIQTQWSETGVALHFYGSEVDLKSHEMVALSHFYTIWKQFLFCMDALPKEESEVMAFRSVAMGRHEMAIFRPSPQKSWIDFITKYDMSFRPLEMNNPTLEEWRKRPDTKQPVLIKGIVSSWPLFHNWSWDYLLNKYSSGEISYKRTE